MPPTVVPQAASPTRATRPFDQDLAFAVLMESKYSSGASSRDRRLLETHGERFPTLASALSSAGQAREEMDQAWEFGLERILDGLAVLIERRGGVAGRGRGDRRD